MRYLTDNERLYEFVTEHFAPNAGRLGGNLRTVIAIDCLTGEPVRLSGAMLQKCHDVVPMRDPDRIGGLLNARYHA